MSLAESMYTSMAQTNEERDQLVMEQLPQVYYIARRIHERLPEHVPFDDLVHAGVLGLIEALRNFDSTKKIQIKTFAQFRIRGAILDSLRDMDWGSRLMRKKGREVEEAITKLSASMGRYPSEQELADELRIDVAQLHKLVAKLDGLGVVGQLTESVYAEGEGFDLIESAVSTDPSPFELYARGETKDRLASAISKLSKNEQLVLSLYYTQELTMKEAAAVLKVTESRVSQLHSVALAKLRATLQKGAVKSGDLYRETDR